MNPNERYTIDQFLAHPWIKAGEEVEQPVQEPVSETVPDIAIDTPVSAPLENRILSNVAAMTPTYGVPKTPYKRRAENPLSPGIGLKEVFDVSNAVHRMEEESSRRRHAANTPSAGLHPVDALNTSTRQRQAFLSQLNEEDEMEEEDEEGSNSDGTGSILSDDETVMAIAGLSDVHIGIHHNAQVESSVKDSEAEVKRLLLQQQQQQEYQKAQESIAAEHHQKYLAQQQQAGHTIPVQHSLPVSSSSINTSSSSAMTGTTAATSSSSVRSNQVGPSKSINTICSSTSASTVSSTSTTASAASRRRRAGFELNMNQATLLNRRAKNHPLASHQTVEEQDQFRHDTPAMAV